MGRLNEGGNCYQQSKNYESRVYVSAIADKNYKLRYLGKNLAHSSYELAYLSWRWFSLGAIPVLF